jgi:hypothetical protein
MTGIVREIARIAKIEKTLPLMNTDDTDQKKPKPELNRADRPFLR